MTKLIGTGKDPRMPEGVDFDVREEAVDSIVSDGLGTPLKSLDDLHTAAAHVAKTEAPQPAHSAVGLDIGDGDRGKAKGTPQDPNHPSRSGVSEEGDGHDDDSAGSKEVSEKMTREDLNARATAAGVDDPESYPNKPELVKAIRDAEADDQE